MIKKIFLLPLLFLISTMTFSQELSLYDLTCEHRVNPIGIETDSPRLSWKIKSSGRNILQTYYSIRVSETQSFSDEFVWETGKIKSSKSNLVSYTGSVLESTKRYFWQVKIWDNHNNESSWSVPSYWEMGILNLEEWKAKWIEPVQDTLPNGPAFYLRKDFTLTNEISKARVYVTAHGIYELSLNGKKVSDDLFTPGWTTYQKRLQYQVYDVTSLLNSEGNTIGAMLGDGWYKGNIGWEDQSGYYGKKLGLLCQLVIKYKDGTTKIISTDKSWKATGDGAITLNSIYNGESYNANKELGGWNTSSYDFSNWKNVKVANYKLENLVPTISVPVKRIQELKPIKIWKTPKGTLVADMGQNMVGWVKLNVKGAARTVVTMKYAEVLDKHGEFYTDNLRSAKATTKYTLKGKGLETYEPKFTFMGFRYVALEGFPGNLKPENLTGIVIHSDMKPSGTFECSNTQINQLQKNIQWGEKGNFLDVPTDCPQRDERMGWTGDAQAFVRTAAYNMDVASFFTKWLKDVEAEQDERGAIPFVVPNVLGEVKASAGWADVVTIAPWTMYQVYGDKRILENQYPSMKKYVDFIRIDAGDNFIWKGGSVFGDWLFYKPELAKWTVPDGHTSQDLIATAFYAYSTKILIKAAQELGKDEDVKEYAKVFEKVKKAFSNNYLTPLGRTSSDSQTSYVLALMFDLLSDKQKPNAVENLVQNIRDRKNHLSTGFLGTPYICHVLSDNGRTDVAYDLLLQETFPSWLYPVKMGATTIWERWDGIKTDSTFQNVTMNSFNHYAYGAIGDWMYRVVAGLEIGEPGYKKIIINPQPDARLSFAKTTYESGYGKIESGWELNGDKLKVNVVIPPNTSAKIILSSTKFTNVMENGKPILEVIKNAKEINGNVVLEVGSGNYSFNTTQIK
ncbi:MAG: glycoside hydrolase family 78 protein [Melioribacteraceae bacterium]